MQDVVKEEKRETSRQAFLSLISFYHLLLRLKPLVRKRERGEIAMMIQCNNW